MCQRSRSIENFFSLFILLVLDLKDEYLLYRRNAMIQKRENEENVLLIILLKFEVYHEIDYKILYLLSVVRGF